MTQNDLSQIRTIDEEVLEQKLEEKLEQKFEEKLKPINKKLTSMDKKIVSMDKKINHVQEGQNIIIGYIDDQDTRLEKRVSHIENHLHLPASTI